MAAKKKYAKVDAETQTDCCEDDKNKKISSFFKPLREDVARGNVTLPEQSFKPLREDVARGTEQSFKPIVKTAAMLSAKPLMIKLEDDL
jgi:hypothetical protein